MARERYLLDVGEDTIHTGVIELKTRKDKFKNWWHYNKRILLFSAIAGDKLDSVCGDEGGPGLYGRADNLLQPAH